MSRADSIFRAISSLALASSRSGQPSAQETPLVPVRERAPRYSGAFLVRPEQLEMIVHRDFRSEMPALMDAFAQIQKRGKA